MAAPEDRYVVDFPTLGDLIDAWVEQHCRVPDGFARRSPFKMADWQFWCTANHYRIRPGIAFTAPQDATETRPVLLNQAFVYRRSQIVAPQKTGKGPWAAALTCVEAVGPSLFGGWAKRGEQYRCEDFGCGCGFVFDYEPGEPKGMRHPSPLIQLTATSEDQVDNVYRPLTAMIRMGPLGELMLVREGFIRILGVGDDPDLDRIDVVTASANSRLGNPITFAVQDETGLYTDQNRMRKVADTQRRGVAGMGGRTLETTNAWDPSEDSVAQRTHESRSTDVFRFYRQPPKNLSYRNKRERRRIHEYVYRGSWWVILDSIEAEAAEMLEKDPAQAERFFGNKIVQGHGAWMPDGLWASRASTVVVPDGAQVCGGFDGSDSDDWTALRLETISGHRFTPTYGPDDRPAIWNPAEWGGRIPRSEVDAAVDEVFERYRVGRLYCDPPDWRSEIGDWAARYGEGHVLEWPTYRIVPMHAALERSLTDLTTGRSTHDGCGLTSMCVGNARKLARPGQRYVLGKPAQHQKIDPAMADVLAHEAAADARAAGWGAAPEPVDTRVLVTRR